MASGASSSGIGAVQARGEPAGLDQGGEPLVVGGALLGHQQHEALTEAPVRGAHHAACLPMPVRLPEPSLPTNTAVPRGVRARRSLVRDGLPPMSRMRS